MPPKLAIVVDDAKICRSIIAGVEKAQENTIGAICVFFDRPRNDAPADLFSFFFFELLNERSLIIAKEIAIID